MRFITVKEAAEQLSVSLSTVYTLIHNGKLKAQRVTKKKMQISQEEIIRFLKNHILFEESYESFVTIQQASKELCLKPATVRQYIQSGKIPNAIRNPKHLWLIPKATILYLQSQKKIPKNYLSVEETAKKISKHPQVVKKYIRDGTFFQNRIIIKRKIYIPITDIQDYETTFEIPKGFITVQEASIKLDKDDSTILPLIHNGEFPNAYFHKLQKRYFISETDITAYIKRKLILKGYISITECARKLACIDQDVFQMIKHGDIKFTKKNFQGESFVLEKEIHELVDLQKISKEHFTLEQASIELEIPTKDLLRFIQSEKLLSTPLFNSVSYPTHTFIPKSTIASLKGMNEKSFSLTSIELYHKKISTINYQQDLQNTMLLYHEFVALKLSQTRGQKEVFIDKAYSFFNTFNSIIHNLKEEITLLLDDDIEEILSNKKIPISHKQNFIHFLHYCTSKTQCLFQNTYKIEYNERLKKEKEIYDKETFLAFYTYVNRIELHITMAKNNQRYAQTWLFVMMHMINGWRKSTIVNELPNLLLEELKDWQIFQLEQVNDQGLTQNQAQSIINYYYIKCKHVYISKTGSFGQFLCHEDMVVPVATALLVCELHRRKSQEQERLLGSLSQYSNSNQRFHTFFRKEKELPTFNSLIMNRSLLTHFFYTVTHAGKHSDLSHELTKNLRNHRNINSITAYVQSTNRDRAIDTVSLHLFNRGTFGWLYHFILDLAMDTEFENSTLENRTAIIQVFKNNYSPSQLEDLSFLLLKYQNERKSLIDTFTKLPKGQIIDIIIKILKGEKPSKTKHIQCITYPQCSFPNLDSCLHCPNAVFNIYVFIHIVEELKKLSVSLQTTFFDTIRYRDTIRFIFLLDIINQAISELGKSYIETFINFEVLENMITENSKYFLYDTPIPHSYIPSK
ncbi:DNA-binding protein [Bacillus cereus]|uniref:DNA-binding protein n=1 Tax=Bacillus cereus TaxID=1396 RepID=A0A9X7CIR9_BACCE|nr:helix-turn-helix domain-containing protein [Bacillus cereus]PGS68221.1 DNA-binding protein [Bacillus cereus]